MSFMRSSLLAAAGLVAALAVTAPVEAKTPADALVMAKDIDDIVSLDPAEAFELSGLEITTNVYDRLMRYDAEDVTKLVGGAAESWTVSADKKTFTFKVRPGIKFASGAPLTADDIVFSLQRSVILNKAPAYILQQLGWDDKNVKDLIKATDPTTVTATIKEDFGTTFVLNCFSANLASIVEKKVAMAHEKNGDLGNEWLKTNSAGSGAYVLKSWKADDSVVLEANPNTWQAAAEAEAGHRPPRQGAVLAAPAAREGRHRHGAGPDARHDQGAGREQGPRGLGLSQGGRILSRPQPDAGATEEAQGARGDALADRLPGHGQHVPQGPVPGAAGVLARGLPDGARPTTRSSSTSPRPRRCSPRRAIPTASR